MSTRIGLYNRGGFRFGTNEPDINFSTEQVEIVRIGSKDVTIIRLNGVIATVPHDTIRVGFGTVRELRPDSIEEGRS